jgi:Cu/Ag efflux protein CusF
MSTAKAVVYVAAVVVLIGCGDGNGGRGGTVPPAAAPAQTAAKQYDIRGRVEAISRERGTVTLDHEEIPGVMAAMKMEYDVTDPSILDQLAVGDSVAGRIEERSGSYVIVSLQKR